jgi:hypothetical protein
MTSKLRIAVSGCCLVVATGGAPRAAELIVRAPEGCVDAPAVTEQVNDLVGRPLTSVAGVDFKIEIAAAIPPAKGWRLRIDTVETNQQGPGPDQQPRSRGSFANGGSRQRPPRPGRRRPASVAPVHEARVNENRIQFGSTRWTCIKAGAEFRPRSRVVCRRI